MQRIKVILLITALLLTGFVGGFLTNRYWVQQRVHHFRQLDKGQGFGDFFLKNLETTPEQEAQLRPLLKTYGSRFRALADQHRTDRRQLTDSLFTEMTPLLTEEQLKQSDRWRNILQRGPKKGKKQKKEAK